MKNIFLLGTLISTFLVACGQDNSDDASLMKEATDKLNNGASVSEILTDPKFLSVHSEKKFREIIKSKSNTAVLKITTSNEPGKKIRVLCTIMDKEGNPVPGALVYLYQTDTKGWYAANQPHVGGNEGDMGHARLFGYVKTDSSGKFELHTVKPSGYPQSDLPAHIHVHCWKTGYLPYVSEFLFDNDERLTGSIRDQAVRSRYYIALPEKSDPPFVEQFTYTMTLQKD